MSKLIITDTEIKDLSKISANKRNLILQKKQEAYIEIYRILSSIHDRTDKKGIQLNKRYYKSLYYIYEDILKIRGSLFSEGISSENREGFVYFEDTHRVFINTLSSYRETFKKHLEDKDIIKDALIKMTPEEIINFLREPLLEKRIGLRRYKPRKK